MEELKKLEAVERMLRMMQSHGFDDVTTTTNITHSSRFLANLCLFLIQPCGELDMNTKCSLVVQNIGRISPSFLEEASRSFNQQGCLDFSVANDELLVNDAAEHGPMKKKLEDMALVGLDAMQRANSTLEDFCRSYFMFHGMDINRPHSIFQYLPILLFTESYIYQMDRLNEKMVNFSTRELCAQEKRHELEANGSLMTSLINLFNADPFEPLKCQLKSCGLLTERVIKEFHGGVEYWALERKLCTALKNQNEISIDDVLRAIYLKSFDYRVLNLLLYQLRGEQVNEVHLEFLSASEFLVEVADDLFDYEDDVLENNFNIMRMFVKIYGPSKAPSKLAKHIAESEKEYELLLQKLDPELSLNYQRRCEEATREGGNTAGNPLGTWSIPHVIADEESYRQSVMSCEY